MSSTNETPSRWNLVARLRERARLARGREYGGDEQLKIGLLPEQGWGKRNWKFYKEVLVPEYFRPREGSTRVHPLPPVAPHEIGLVWIGHASFLVRIGGKTILIDPNWARWLGHVKRVREPGLHPEDLPPVDMVLISHAHHDHLHMGSLRKIAEGQPIIVPHGVGGVVKRGGFGEVVELDCWQTVERGGIEITLTPARHWGARHIHDTHRGFGGFVIRAGGRSVFHCGDSSYFDGFGEIGERFPGLDVALLPIGAYGAPSGREVHMDPEQALEAFRMLRARRMVPMHYATFPLGTEPMGEPLQRLLAGAEAGGITHSIDALEEGDQLRF